MNTTIGRETYISHYGGLKCVGCYPIIEDSFESEELDTDFWEPFTRGSGNIEFKNGIIELNSGKTSGGLAKITSKKTAHAISGQNLVFECSLNMNTYQLDNPSIRWGMYSLDNSSALYFDFNSSSFVKFLYPITMTPDGTQIQFHSNFSGVDDFYNDYYSVFVTDRSNRYEIREIVDYDGTTKKATLNKPLDDVINPEKARMFLVGHVLDATHNSITIAPNSTDVEDFYKGDLIYIMTGKGKGQLRGISEYDGVSKIIVVSGWDIIPDASSRYIVTSRPVSSEENSITLKEGFSETDDRFNGVDVMIIYGAGGGQVRKVIDYVGSQRKVIIDNNWDAIPNVPVFQCVMRVDGINYAVTSGNFDGKLGWKPPGHNITYRIVFGSELVEFYISENGRLERLTTFKDESLNFTSIAQYTMLFASANVGSTKNNFLQVRECNISVFGNIKLFRPLGDNVGKRNLSQLTTSVLLGKTDDDQFKNIKVDDQGRVVLSPHAEPDVSSEVKHILGKNYDVDTFEVPEDIWQFGGLYTFPNIPSIIYVKSSDNDDKPGSKGAHTLKIEGLDSNYDPLEETINLNGKSEVVTLGTYLRLNNAYVTGAGSDEQNDGVINIQMNHSSGGRIFVGKINPGTNSTLNSIFTVPKGKKGLVHQISTDSTLSKTKKKDNREGNVELRVRQVGGVFITKSIIGIGDIKNYTKPIEIHGKSDIRLTVRDIEQGDHLLSGAYTLELIPK